MAELPPHKAKIRFSIATDGALKSKPQVFNNYHELANNQDNFVEILSWCKKLNLFDNKYFVDIESNTNMKTGDKLKLILKNIQDNTKCISPENLKIMENIVKNLAILNDPNLNEYTEQLPDYVHIDRFDVQKTQHPTINTSIIPAYPMRTKNRGVLFFVNMINFPLDKNKIRNGAEYDKIYMIRLFREYGFTIYYYEDLLADTFWKLLNRLIHDYLDGTESLILALASHGDKSNNVEFYYGQTINIDDIVHKFNDLNCLSMCGKPKVLMFPCCRGSKPDAGVVRGTNLQTDGDTNARPTFSDMLICYATVHGYASLRDSNFGSWYIEAFCKVLAQYGHTHHLESMLQLVTLEINKMANKCNAAKLKKGEDKLFLTASFICRDFNKLLFFNPGFVDNVLMES